MAAIDPDLDVGGRVSLEDAFTGPAAKISKAFQSMRAQLAGGAGFITRALNSFTGGLGGIGRYLTGGGILDGLGALTQAAVKSGSAMENNRLAFTTLLGSAQLAQEHLDELRQFAIGKPFEFTELVTASRTLQSFGFKVGQVKGLLTDMGNAAFAAGTGRQGMDRMIRVFGQIHATGKTTLGNLNTLVRSGLPAYDILREQLHLTDEQLKKIAKSGIAGDKVIEALRAGMQKRFDGGMDRASQTITARLSDLQDVAEGFLTMVGDALAPTIKGFLDEIGSAMPGKEGMKAFAQGVADTLTTVMNLLRSFIQPFLGAFGDVGRAWGRDTKSAGAGLKEFLAGVRDVVQGITALLTSADENGMASMPKKMHDQLVKNGLLGITVKIAMWGQRLRWLFRGIIDGVVNTLRGMGRTLVNVAGPFGKFTSGLMASQGTVRSLGEWIGKLIGYYLAYRGAMMALSVVMAVVRVATIAWTAAQWLINVAMGANPVGLVILAVAALAVGIALVIKYWDRLKPYVMKYWTPVAEFFKSWWVLVRNFWTTVIPFIWSVIQGVWNAIRPFVTWIITTWSSIYQTLKPILIEAFTALWGFIKDVWARAKPIVLKIVEVFGNAWTWVKTNAVAAWETISSTFATVGAKLAVFWEGIKTGGAAAAAFVTNAFTTIKDSLLSSLKWVVSQILSLYDALPDWAKPDRFEGIANGLRKFSEGDPSLVEHPDAAHPLPPQLEAVRSSLAQKAAAQRASAPQFGPSAAPAGVTVHPMPFNINLDSKPLLRGLVELTQKEAQRQGKT